VRWLRPALVASDAGTVRLLEDIPVFSSPFDGGRPGIALAATPPETASVLHP
jgi:hypothetical protein